MARNHAVIALFDKHFEQLTEHFWAKTDEKDQLDIYSIYRTNNNHPTNQPTNSTIVLCFFVFFVWSVFVSLRCVVCYCCYCCCHILCFIRQFRCLRSMVLCSKRCMLRCFLLLIFFIHRCSCSSHIYTPYFGYE